MLAHEVCFSDTNGRVRWGGKRASDSDEFCTFLRGAVWARLTDADQAARFESDLRAVAATEMAVSTLEQVLLSSRSEREPWEIGEALAECLLEEGAGVRWPWNMERDKRTPKASLLGADLIGFVETDGGMLLLVGEVKTSSDASNPPGVMTGRSGMVHQLDTLATDLEIQSCLLRWLHHRCLGTSLWPVYQEAASKYLSSGGKALVLWGMLMRDTEPHRLDLQNRAEVLSAVVTDPTLVELNAWYFPDPATSWPALTSGGTA